MLIFFWIFIFSLKLCIVNILGWILFQRKKGMCNRFFFLWILKILPRTTSNRLIIIMIDYVIFVIIIKSWWLIMVIVILWINRYHSYTIDDFIIYGIHTEKFIVFFSSWLNIRLGPFFIPLMKKTIDSFCFVCLFLNSNEFVREKEQETDWPSNVE